MTMSVGIDRKECSEFETQTQMVRVGSSIFASMLIYIVKTLHVASKIKRGTTAVEQASHTFIVFFRW